MKTPLSCVGLHQRVAGKDDSEGEEEGLDLSPSQSSEDQSQPEEGIGSAEGDWWLPSCGSWAKPMCTVVAGRSKRTAQGVSVRRPSLSFQSRDSIALSSDG